jgi:hypothetical protein
MKNKLVNIALKNDLKNFLKNPTKIGEIRKGDVSGFSIEVEEKDPQSFSSYTYYENEKLRDADFEELQTLIKENNEKN